MQEEKVGMQYDGIEGGMNLQPSPGWVPAAVAAVKRMSAQAIVAHALLQKAGSSPDGELLLSCRFSKACSSQPYLLVCKMIISVSKF
jgi:hypothetical protein